MGQANKAVAEQARETGVQRDRAISGAETRKFRMHPDLLWSVIQAQAGVREKALAEAVMNAIDAGATECRLRIDGDGYEIIDNGRGFTARQEIEDFFETFGTPHQEGDATYGRFRMGRGQLFAFSKTLWRSGQFAMDVDIKSKGLAYDLQEGLDEMRGCTITGTWYDYCDISEVIRTVHEVTDLVQWMGITGVSIFINDRKVDKDVTTQTWTLETDDAYINVKTSSGLSVYNLGVLVREYPPHHFGICGTIVSKQRLQVNFARNDILVAECKVWRRIRSELDRLTGKIIARKTLYDFERDAIAKKFACGEMSYWECASIGIITDASGRKRPLKELEKAKRICLVERVKDWIIGERVMEQKLAFVLRAETLDRFKVESLEGLLNLLKDKVNLTSEQKKQYQTAKAMKDYATENQLSRVAPCHGIFDHLEIVKLSTVATHIQDQERDIIIDLKNLSPHQKAIHKALEAVSTTMAKYIEYYRSETLPAAAKEQRNKQIEENIGPMGWRRADTIDPLCPKREVLIGKSDVAHMWTDGKTYIAVNIQLVNNLLNRNVTLSKFLSIFLHEYCHDEEDKGGHVHSPDFFEEYHELMCHSEAVERSREELLRVYFSEVMKEGRKPKSHLVSSASKDERMTMMASPAAVALASEKRQK